MSEQIFEIGQTVRLKSGGPLMTIEALNTSDYITCIWFDDDKIVRQQFLASLVKPDDDNYVTFNV